MSRCCPCKRAAVGVIADDALGACINTQLSRAVDTPITNGDLAGLTRLLCNSQGIRTLDGLEAATNLEVVQLTYNRDLADFSPLAGAIRMQSLELRSTAVTDLSFMANMTQLTAFDVTSSAAGPSAATYLRDKTNLTSLTLNNADVTDISWMSGLVNLTELVVSNNQITDISVLANMPKLRTFRALANEIADVSVLGTLPSLTTANLGANAIDDLRPVADVADVLRYGQWIVRAHLRADRRH